MARANLIVRNCAILCAAILLAGCAEESQAPAQQPAAPESAPQMSAAEGLSAFKAAIRAKYDMKEKAFRDNDPEPILTRFYSDQVISTDFDGNTHRGREELRPLYEEVIVSLVTIESYDTFVNGDAGWDWVNFHVNFPPGIDVEPFTFKMLFLWERIDGEWWSRGEMYVNGEFDIQ